MMPVSLAFIRSSDTLPPSFLVPPALDGKPRFRLVASLLERNAPGLHINLAATAVHAFALIALLSACCMTTSHLPASFRTSLYPHMHFHHPHDMLRLQPLLSA